MPAAKHKQTTN